MENRNCVVCYQDISGIQLAIDHDEYGQDECSSLKYQLPVLFMIQKFLEIPSDVCSHFLKDYGNPSSWIHWCSSCAVLVKKAKTCFDEIASLQRRFETLRVELKNIISQSEQTRQKSPIANKQLENTFSNGVTDIVRSYILEDKMGFPQATVQIKEEVEQFDGDDTIAFMEISPLIDMELDFIQNSFPVSKSSLLTKGRRKLSSKSKRVHHRKKKSHYSLSGNITKYSLEGESAGDTSNNNNPLQEESGSLKEDSKFEDQEKVFRCKQCPKEFKNKDYLRKHLKFHLDRPYKCQVCGKRFVRLQDVKEHSLNHNQDRPFSCTCGKSFRQACSLGRHQRDQECGRLHECTVCHEEFDQISKLKSHATTAHCDVIKLNQKIFEEKPKRKSRKSPSQCSVCGKILSRLQDLKRHLLTHTGERPHSCPVCGKTFKQSGEVTIHMRIHTGEKPFSCKGLQNEYGAKGSFKSSLRSTR